jgi:hypothetical protein
MGSLNNKGEKEGRWLEGRQSEEHVHKDGSKGRDVEAFHNTYREGKQVHSEKARDWGKVHKN